MRVSFGLTNKLEKRLSSNEDSSLNDENDENEKRNEGPVGSGFKDTSLDRITRFAAKHNVEYESPQVIIRYNCSFVLCLQVVSLGSFGFEFHYLL